jgi:pyridoxamine 5'-phosphate oxidase like protein
MSAFGGKADITLTVAMSANDPKRTSSQREPSAPGRRYMQKKRAAQMNNPTKKADHERIWELIKGSHSALLITVKPDGALDSRPMGCLQTGFDGILWFLNFAPLAETSRNWQQRECYGFVCKAE